MTGSKQRFQRGLQLLDIRGRSFVDDNEVNSELLQTVAGWHQATIADWYDASAGPGIVVDGTHTSPAGARVFAAVISRAIHSPHLGGVTH